MIGFAPRSKFAYLFRTVSGLPDRPADVSVALGGRTMLVRLGADGSVRADAQ